MRRQRRRTCTPRSSDNSICQRTTDVAETAPRSPRTVRTQTAFNPKAACNNLRHAGPCEGHYATTVHAGLPNHYQKGDDPRPTAFGRTGTCAHMRPSSPKNGPDRHMQPFFHACWNGPRCAARHRHSHTRPVPSPRLATYLAERQTSTTIDAGPLRRLRKKTQNQCGQR